MVLQLCLKSFQRAVSCHLMFQLLIIFQIHRGSTSYNDDSPNSHHRSKVETDLKIDGFVILDEVGDEQVPSSDRLDDRDEISLSEEEEDNDALEKVSSDEDENEDDNHSFENISSPEHVTNASDAKLDFENVDSPEEHVEQQHEDLEAVDSPEEGKHS